MPTFKSLHVYAGHPQTKRGFATVLTASPKGDRLVYGCGQTVVLRNIANPLDSEIVAKHKCPVTAARISPTGAYCASGDAQGNVIIWAVDHSEKAVKLECRPITGVVNDIAWSPDGQRLIVVGEGQERFGHAFLIDTGSSVGEISGHSKTVFSCDFKPTRPFAVVTGGQDFQVNIFRGPPFKFEKSLTEHSNFVQGVRFTPSGENFVSVGSDSKIFVYDTKSGEKVGQIEDPKGHVGTIYGLSFSPDGKFLMTAGADKTIRIWDFVERKLARTLSVAAKPAIPDMQVGCVWTAGGSKLSISLGNSIYYFGDDADVPSKILRGHSAPVTAIVLGDKDSTGRQTVFTGDNEGRVCKWILGEGCAEFSGEAHGNVVSGASWSAETGLNTVGKDDKLRVGNGSSSSSTVSIGGAPNDLTSWKDHHIVAHHNGIDVVSGGRVTQTVKTASEALSAAFHPDGSSVAVGCKDFKIRVYRFENGTLLTDAANVREVTRHRGQVTALSFSRDGRFLASGDSNREIIVWNAESFETAVTGWEFHTARVSGLDWSPCGRYLASASLDTHLFIWDTEKPRERLQITNAHVGGVNVVKFVDENTIVSGGYDSHLKTWSLTF